MSIFSLPQGLSEFVSLGTLRIPSFIVHVDLNWLL